VIPRVEVIVVGGGPAGSSAAFELRRRRIECLVLDPASFPRLKLCAGWVTPEVLSDLGIEPGEYPHRLLTFRALHVHLGPLSRRIPTVQHSIRRFEFDAWLLRRSGAPVVEHEVKSIRREGEEFVIDERFRCRHLVGAGGTRCPVARSFFRDLNPRPVERQAVTLEEEFSYEWSDEDCHLWFFEKGLPGYAWYVPKARGFLNVGIGGLKGGLQRRGAPIRAHWDRLVRRLGGGLVPGHDFDPGGYSYFVRGEAVVGQLGRAYVTGDAAGLATRDLCEGIGPAVRSGLLAARAIADDLPYRLDGVSAYTGGRRWLSRVLAAGMRRGIPGL
jgi:flavin-dependent dehydrogenase